MWRSVQGVSVSLMMQVRMAQCPAMEEQASARVPGVSLASGPRLRAPQVPPASAYDWALLCNAAGPRSPRGSGFLAFLRHPRTAPENRRNSSPRGSGITVSVSVSVKTVEIQRRALKKQNTDSLEVPYLLHERRMNFLRRSSVKKGNEN